MRTQEISLGLANAQGLAVEVEVEALGNESTTSIACLPESRGRDRTGARTTDETTTMVGESGIGAERTREMRVTWGDGKAEIESSSVRITIIGEGEGDFNVPNVRRKRLLYSRRILIPLNCRR